MPTKKYHLLIWKIIIIILLLGVLAWGFFTQKIFASKCVGVEGLSDQQILDEAKKSYEESMSKDPTFSEIINDIPVEKNINFYPMSAELSIKRGGCGEIAFNIYNEKPTNESFFYNISVLKMHGCRITKSEAESFIKLGKTGENIKIVSKFSSEKLVRIGLAIPNEGEKGCIVMYSVNVIGSDETLYSSKEFFINVR